MKKKKFLNKKDWDKIIDNAFSSDEEHVFSDHYEVRKRQMQRSIIMTRSKGTKRKKITAVIAASVAAVVIIPTSVFAYNKITSNIEKTADHQTTVDIQTPSDAVTPVQDVEQEEKYMYYQFNWLPDGYEENHENGVHIKKTETKESIAPQFYKLPENADIKIPLDFSNDCENYESGNKNAMINYRAKTRFDESAYYYEEYEPIYDRCVFISFADTTYLLKINVNENVSREDLLKIIDNVELIETEDKRYGDYVPFLDEESSSPNPSYSEVLQPIDHESVNMMHIGDTGNYDDEYGGFEFKLESAELTDNLEGINTNSCGWETDYSHIIDENGKLIENIRKTIKLGDGVNSVDEVISEEPMPMYVMKIKGTFTNTKDTENKICISPTMFIIRDGIPLSSSFIDFDGSGYNTIDSISGYDKLDFFSFDTDTEHKGGKNEIILQPGESAEIQLAYFVPEDLKDELYLIWDMGYSYDKVINKGFPVFELKNP